MRHPSVRVALSLASLVALATVGACSDSTGPGLMGHSYALLTVDGHPLPLVVSATPEGDTTQLVGESISFGADGQGVRQSFFRTVVAGVEVESPSSIGGFRYRVSGPRVSLLSFCHATAGCGNDIDGVASGSQLLLTDSNVAGARRWVYGRADFHTTSDVTR